MSIFTHRGELKRFNAASAASLADLARASNVDWRVESPAAENEPAVAANTIEERRSMARRFKFIFIGGNGRLPCPALAGPNRLFSHRAARILAGGFYTARTPSIPAGSAPDRAAGRPGIKKGARRFNHFRAGAVSVGGLAWRILFMQAPTSALVVSMSTKSFRGGS